MQTPPPHDTPMPESVEDKNKMLDLTIKKTTGYIVMGVDEFFMQSNTNMTNPESVGSKAMVCNHFMVWNIQGGYSYYRCDKCTFIDGEETFKQRLLTSYAAGVAEGRSSMKRDIEAVVLDVNEYIGVCKPYVDEYRSELLGKIGGIWCHTNGFKKSF